MGRRGGRRADGRPSAGQGDRVAGAQVAVEAVERAQQVLAAVLAALVERGWVGRMLRDGLHALPRGPPRAWPFATLEAVETGVQAEPVRLRRQRARRCRFAAAFALTMRRTNAAGSGASGRKRTAP